MERHKPIPLKTLKELQLPTVKGRKDWRFELPKTQESQEALLIKTRELGLIAEEDGWDRFVDLMMSPTGGNFDVINSNGTQLFVRSKQPNLKKSSTA